MQEQLVTIQKLYCEKHSIDITLSRFLGNVIKILILAFVIIIVIGKMSRINPYLDK